jgi:hypothetical protein
MGQNRCWYRHFMSAWMFIQRDNRKRHFLEDFTVGNCRSEEFKLRNLGSYKTLRLSTNAKFALEPRKKPKHIFQHSKEIKIFAISYCRVKKGVLSTNLLHSLQNYIFSCVAEVLKA